MSAGIPFARLSIESSSDPCGPTNGASMVQHILRAAGAFCLLVGSLSTSGRAATRNTPAWDGTVRVDGALRAMFHEGRTGAVVSLESVLPGATRYGVGALADLAGEITIVAGKAYMSTPDGEIARTTMVSASRAGATLLVTADVPRWQRVVLEEPIDFADLDDAIGRLAQAAGMDLETRFPFVLEGTFENLEWHVVDGSRLAAGGSSHQDHLAAAVRARRDRTTATLIGFYSQHDERVFTHMGSKTHVHCVVTDPVAAGHVDRVRVPAGATVMFPDTGQSAPH